MHSLIYKTLVFVDAYIWSNLHSCVFIYLFNKMSKKYNIGCVMIYVLASCALYIGFELRSGQTINYKNLCLLLLRQAWSIKEQEQRLVSS